jgi:hypothetical protein
MIGTVADVAGAVIVTEAGTDTCPSADSDTVTDPFGAAFSLTVPVAVMPCTTFVGSTTTLDTATVVDAGGEEVEEVEVVQPDSVVVSEVTTSLIVTRHSGAEKPPAATR